MKRLVLLAAVLFAGATSAVAQTTSGTGKTRGGTATGDVPFDVLRRHLNGFVDFELRAPLAMTPPSTGFPRTAIKTAQVFLKANAVSLGIHQDVADLPLLASQIIQEGKTLVRFGQTWQGLDIESASFSITVSGQVVERVSARFISDVSRLSVCSGLTGLLPQIAERVAREQGHEPIAPPQVLESLFRPYGAETHFTVILSEDVASGSMITALDGCTGELLDGYTEY